MDEKKTQSSDTSADEQKGEDGKGENQPKSFTQEDVNKLISERVNDVKAKTQKEFQELLKKERQDWEVKAKMSEEEKLQAEREQKERELDERDKNVRLSENKILAHERLDELGLPKDKSIIEMLVTDNPDSTVERINAFEKSFNAEVVKRVEEKISGKAPTDPTTKNQSEAKKGSLLF